MKKSDLVRTLGILDLVVVCACIGKIPGLLSSVVSQPLLVGGIVMTTVLVGISGYTHLILSAKAPIWYYSSLPLRVFLGQLTFMFLLWTFPETSKATRLYEVLVCICFALELGRLLFTLHYHHKTSSKAIEPSSSSSAAHG